jgi:uncharacterized protein
VTRRGALLVPAAALAVHQLRYQLAYGGDARALLAEQGHAYLHSLTPWIVLAACVAFGGYLGRAASAWRGRAEAHQVATARIWLLATTGLIAIYAGQELLEGLLATGHPAGLAGVFGAGGWLAVPSAVLVAAALALALRGAERLVARLARRLVPARPRPPATPRPRPVFARPRAPPSTRAAGRAPPRPRSDPRHVTSKQRNQMTRSTIALAIAGAGLVSAPAAQAHVTIHPNVIPEGAFAVLDLRVPNETDDVDTTKVQVELPDGFAFASAEVPTGWKVAYKRTKLATPIETDDGKIDTQVKQVTFSGSKIPPGQFLEFPLSVGMPGKSGDTLTFKALQTYSNGDVVRWIGPPDADEPAPTITISDKGGLIQDSTGEGAPAAEAAPAAPATTKVVEKQSSNGLAIAALIVGALGLVAGGVALTRRRAT